MISQNESEWPHEAERLILCDLAAVGVHVEHIQDLCMKGSYAPTAVPVLLKWLFCTEYWDIADCIARVLVMPWARCSATAHALCDRFESAPNTGRWLTAKWSMGNALSFCATKEHASRVAYLFQDRRYAYAREMLADALVRTKHPDALQILVGAIDEMPLNAISALKRLKDPRAIPAIERFRNDSRAAVRRAARKAIERLQSIASKQQ